MDRVLELLRRGLDAASGDMRVPSGWPRLHSTGQLAILPSPDALAESPTKRFFFATSTHAFPDPCRDLDRHASLFCCRSPCYWPGHSFRSQADSGCAPPFSARCLVGSLLSVPKDSVCTPTFKVLRASLRESWQILQFCEQSIERPTWAEIQTCEGLDATRCDQATGEGCVSAAINAVGFCFRCLILSFLDESFTAHG